MSSSVRESRVKKTAALASLARTVLVVVGAALQGCSSGSGGSDVGAHVATAPTARIEVLNGGTHATFREGAEVLLTGKASEDGDGPPIAWSWRQTSGITVQLLEANSTTVRFTAPHVETPSVLSFELTVEDSTANLGHATADVTVLPARDSDKFLSLDVARGAPFDSFDVVATLAGGAATGLAPRPFTLSAVAYLVYPARAVPTADCSFDAAEFAGGIPQSTASGCLVAELRDLTPSPAALGGTGIDGEWPAGIEAPDESDALRVTRWWNSRFTLPVPRLDIQEFNQRFVESGERDRMLDAFAAHAARIVLALTLTAPANQQDATIVFPGLVHAPVGLPTLVFAPAPPATMSSIENSGVGLPTAGIVPLDTILASIEGREAAHTSAVYYRTVDPSGTRTTLNAWLRQAGFTATDGTLLPEAIAGTGEFAHAVYVNNFDLGFGRQMYTRIDDLGNVFSFVKNYSTLEGAIRQLDSFATVVTEYSPLVNHTDSSPKFVKFFTFVEDGSGDAPRVASFDFDGRGERFTPGNCVVCHGGARPPGLSELTFDAGCGDRDNEACYAWPARNRDGVAIADGDLGGTFLPWDVASLLFADTDPAITNAPVKFDGVTLQAELLRAYGDFSRGRQLGQVKKLNQAAYQTYTASNDAARRLVESWYGGVDSNGQLLNEVFDDMATVPGWRNGEVVPDPSPANPGGMLVNPPTTEELYHSVYARHCRMCHTSMPDGPLRFDTYQELVVQRGAIRQTVFRAGSMPGARLTMDRFWVPFEGGVPPGERLAQHMASLQGELPDARPGAPVAVIVGLDPAPNRGDTVYLDGGSSVFADSYSWTVLAPAGSAAPLSDPNARFSSFVLDVPGTYEVTLTLNAETAEQTAVTEIVTIGNRAPTATNDLYSLDLVASPILQGSVLAGAHQDSDPDGDALTATLAAGAAPTYGTVALGADGSFTYSYSGGLPPPADSDTFRYNVTDGFGATAEATATILLNGAAGTTRPTAVTTLSAADASTVAAAGSTFAVQLSWLASSDDVQVAGYNVYRNGVLLELVPSAAAPGTTVAYTDNDVAPNTTHSYRVTALDADNESGLSPERVVSVAASLRRNIQTGWGTGTDSLWRASGCIGCHRGAAGGLTLGGTPDAVVTELAEDAAEAAPRRIESAAPRRSLLLCKPLVKSDPLSCPHEGGAFLVSSDPRFQMLMRWVEDSAPNN
jgi:Bacterial Ig domain